MRADTPRCHAKQPRPGKRRFGSSYIKAKRWRPINHQAAQRLVVKGQMVRVFKKENKIFTSSCKKKKKQLPEL